MRTSTEESVLFWKTLRRHDNVQVIKQGKIRIHHKVTYLYDITQISKRITICGPDKGQILIIIIYDYSRTILV